MTEASNGLKGKVALVTGSTQGLGAEIAREFAAYGAAVVVCGRSEEKGRAVAREITEQGGDAFFIPVDLACTESCTALVEETLRHFGGIDILVNSAADTRRSTIRTVTPELFDYQFAVNVKAPVFLTQAAVSSLQERDGVVINIGSINAYIGGPNLLVYSATKGALMTASRNLAHALQFDRVRVYCLNVGWMDTEGERKIQAEQGNPPDFLDQAGKNLPLGRLLRPEDVAGVCVFLASEKGRAFSGMAIDLEQFPVGMPPLRNAE